MIEDKKKSRGIILAFSHRNFAIYVAGNFPSQCGVWAQRFAIGWLTWEFTESAWWLGLMGFADLIPIVLLSPFAGYWTDRHDRLVLAKLLQTLNVIVTLSLTIFAYAGLLNVYVLLVFTVLTGIDHAVFQPVRSALASVLVPRESLPTAIAFGGFTWNSARLIGPAVGAIILHFVGPNAILLINSILYLGFIFALFGLRLPPTPRRETSEKGVIGEIFSGYKYAVSHPAIAPLILILFGGSFLTRPVVELLPGFAAGVFGRGPEGLAFLTSAMGLGAILAGIWIAQRGKLTGLVQITCWALLVGAITLIIFANTEKFEIGVICMVFFGIQYSLFATCIQTLIQSVADEKMRGRVLAFYGLIWMGSAAFGSLFMGGLSEIFGLQLPIGTGGAVCLLVWLWALQKSGKIDEFFEDKKF